MRNERHADVGVPVSRRHDDPAFAGALAVLFRDGQIEGSGAARSADALLLLCPRSHHDVRGAAVHVPPALRALDAVLT